MVTRTETRRMIDAVLRWSLQHRLVVLALALGLIAWGAAAASRTPVDVFPDLTAPSVTVLAEARAMAPEEIERQVTFPIEAALNGAAGVRRVRSATTAGIAIVWVDFDWGTDLFRARQTVAEKVQLVSADLPTGLDPPVLGPVTSIMGEIMFLAVRSPRIDPMELRTLVDATIRPRLLAVPGVAEVVSIGGERKTLQVAVDGSRARDHDVTLAEVTAAVQSANESAAAGFLPQGAQEDVVRGIGRVRTPEDLAATPLRLAQGYPITLRDVADVTWAPAVKRGEGSFDAAPAVVIGIRKQPDANTLEITRRIDAVVDALAPALPDDVVVEREGFRQADFIERAIRNVTAALRDGALLVIIVVLLFLASGRATLVSVVAIPLSLLTAVMCLRWVGANINTMTLGGLAIAVGALVDDAIIDVENVVRRLRENNERPAPARQSVMSVVFAASQEVRRSIVFATLIIGLVFVPVFFLHGIEGRLLAPLGVAYIVALLTSLAVALTVTPALCVWLLPNAHAVRRTRSPRLVRAVRRAYAVVLMASIDRWRGCSLLCLAFVGLALIQVSALGRSLLPTFNEGALSLSVVAPTGTSLEQSDALGRAVEQILLAHPEVGATTRRTGRAESDEHAAGVHSAEIDVRLQPASASHERSYDAFLADVRQQLRHVPGTKVVIGQPLSHRIDHMLSGTRANIAIKIFGRDLGQMRELANAVRKRIATIDGVVDEIVEQPPDAPTVIARFDRAALARYGLTVREVSATLTSALAGQPVSSVFEGNISHDIVVKLHPAPTSVAALANLPVLAASGVQVPLRAVAEIVRDAGPSTISRENTERKTVVSCNVAGRDIGSLVGEIQRAIFADVEVPPGVRIEYGGQFESAERATETLALVSVGVLLGVFVLLVTALASVRDATVVMLNLPLALIGGVAGVVVFDGILSVASMIGFIALFGIATRNGIMLVSHIAHLREHEGVRDPRTAVMRGAQERVIPILMTALATAGGLVPLVFAAGEPGSEIQAPMAMVILCGLATATPLNLIVVPALVLRFGRYRAVPAPRAPRSPARRSGPGRM
ncbi:MAG: efflux RND transporter permease subunit [Myxococcales bacterium FL481]|nr:MAG: efflux RND transporter permease subunit [Myxococcales bacterium FL481]